MKIFLLVAVLALTGCHYHQMVKHTNDKKNAEEVCQNKGGYKRYEIGPHEDHPRSRTSEFLRTMIIECNNGDVEYRSVPTRYSM